MPLPETEIEVRRALAEDEFFPAFQPLVELRSGRLVGFEVLSRWKHPILGTVSPNDFVPMVEDCGLMDEMTVALLRKALMCEDLKQSSLGLSINVSPLQLLQFDSPEKVSAASERSGFQLKRLTIEITETAIVDDLERAKTVAQQLKALGCRLALDDFGTGYSSLKHLQALPFDELKVDQSFVHSITERRESRKIVGAAVGLGQALGLRTIAEGVETEEQANMLFWMGCDVGQGWFFGRPVGIEDLPHLIQRGQHDSFRPALSGMHNVPLFNGEALPTQRLAQLQALFDSAPVGLCLLDHDLHYTNVNAMLAEMNGVPIEAHLGRSVGEVTPDFFPLADPILRAALGGEPVSGVELVKLPTGGGPIRSVLASCQPVRDEAGEVLGVSAAILDVSKHRQLEEALRETEEHFRAVMMLHPHVPWVMNTAGEIIEGSHNWEDITGQKKDDALGDGWLRMLHPDDVQPALDGIRESLKTGTPLLIRFRVKAVGGDWRRMVSRGSARFGPSGSVVCLYGVMEPDGYTGHLPDQLRLRCEQLSAAIEAIPIGVVLAGALDGTIFLVNSVARGLFDDRLCIGQSVSEFSRTPLARADGQPLDVSRFPLARSLLRGEPVAEMEVVYARSERVQLHLVLSSKPIYSSEGRLVGAIMLVQEPGTAGVVRKSRLL
jgi:PAS domain S-box-containing protein